MQDTAVYLNGMDSLSGTMDSTAVCGRLMSGLPRTIIELRR